MNLLDLLFGPGGYVFWLIVVSLGCLAAERIRPWRRQPLLRPQLAQDLFWLAFNGHGAAVVVGYAAAALLGWAQPLETRLDELEGLRAWPLPVQALVAFIAKDFLDWNVHRLLHRVPWLWTFHRVHHSILDMDFLGNFRFHLMEVVVYRSLTYIPLALLGVDQEAMLWVAVISTLIGHLNHSNLDISWGFLRTILNSPRMHIWHHAAEWPREHPYGVNFGICLSVWDYLAGSVWWPSTSEVPSQMPPRLGFAGIERFPRTLLARFLIPFSLIRRSTP